jgi:hypothetical protein
VTTYKVKCRLCAAMRSNTTGNMQPLRPPRIRLFDSTEHVGVAGNAETASPEEA